MLPRAFFSLLRFLPSCSSLLVVVQLPVAVSCVVLKAHWNGNIKIIQQTFLKGINTTMACHGGCQVTKRNLALSPCLSYHAFLNDNHLILRQDYLTTSFLELYYIDSLSVKHILKKQKRTKHNSLWLLHAFGNLCNCTCP